VKGFKTLFNARKYAIYQATRNFLKTSAKSPGSACGVSKPAFRLQILIFRNPEPSFDTPHVIETSRPPTHRPPWRWWRRSGPTSDVWKLVRHRSTASFVITDAYCVFAPFNWTEAGSHNATNEPLQLVEVRPENALPQAHRSVVAS
jgi:hypothetical protein